ncbi:MAG TPA: helix-turn-helix domain-containing protein [Nocardioides sp.]|uniref:helix-turn-helix domain-containing protein n=1 Tax=uncultured Nocardioides sp. TaxID=198441 RepID=UPI0026348C66|nr:helix-turn-helix domain-containing protein [uncultured Nocardioides sp.]HRD62843.1 helix-turn-helix domain-containing protein [Nocardioides sp.]HRI96654.1 helix-turn-helix domain-containing protein [Nocardioides sp.]HRK46346.1 helix-turn-helix domain-containing protein [Nocardioides sp.]
MDTSSITPTPTQLRALTHPVRLRILGILRTEGSTTATALAQRLGLNTGATSYHLRQLAQHGFIVDDEERGNARERWWRAAHASTRTDVEKLTEPGDQEALDAYLQTVVVIYTQMLQQMIEDRATLSEEWRNASTMSDWRCRLNPEQATRLIETVETLIEEFEAAEELPEDDPDGVPYTIMFHGFPRPGGPTGGTS